MISCHRAIKATILTILLTMYSFSEDTINTVEMDLALEDILDVKVTVASKKAESITDAPGTIYVITQDELRRAGIITLKEAIMRIPGMGIATSALTNRSLPVIRGDLIKTNSSHILFLLNGRPIREIQEGGVNSDFIESFPADIISQIEIIRGPGSVLYGSDAFSGVINVKTKVPADKTMTASFTGHYLPESNGGAGGGAGNFLLNTGDLTVVGAARYYQKPDWKPIFHNVYYNTTTYALEDSIIPGDLGIKDQGPGYFLDISYKGLSATGSFVQWKTTAFQNRCNIMPRKYFGNIGYKMDIFDKWKMDINATGTQSDLFTDHPDFIERHSKNGLLENTHFFTPMNNLGIVVGGTVSYIKGKEQDNLSGWGIVSKGHRWAFSGYGQADYTIANRVKLIGGVQVNKTKHIKQHIAPRAGIILYPVEGVSIKSFYAKAFRLPSINELFMDYDIGLFGDKTLKPEMVTTFDQGISYQNDRFMIGVNYFYSTQKDIIQQVLYNTETGDFFSRRYTNLGEVFYHGGEVEGKWYITKEIYINGSLLYQNNHDSLDYNVGPIAEFIGKGGISYSNNRGITVSLFNSYQGPIDKKFRARLNARKKQDRFNLLGFSSEFDIARHLGVQRRMIPSVLFKIDNLLGDEIFLYEYGGFSNEVIPAVRGREFFCGIRLTL